jgi:hypothetical protein
MMQPSPRQSALVSLLRQRGHEVTRIGGTKDILIPQNTTQDVRQTFEDLLFTLMSDEKLQEGAARLGFQ